MDLAKHLSAEQLEAATSTDVPVCILAGAGSGKTRVVTHRIAYLLEAKRARPESILAVTFTNKAAGEMRARVDKLCPGRGAGVLVGTFHGMAARLLRRYGGAVGVPSSFVIYDQDDAERLLKRVVVDELNFAKDLVRPIAHLIEGWQAEGLSPDEVASVHWTPVEDKARKVYPLYLERLAGMRALDFGGLLVKLRDLLRSPAGAELCRRIRHILVDEYQDTNRVQAEITLLFAKAAETVAVVGDDDQAIYGWRGASADNLRRFLEALPGAKLLRLQDNYRSTRTILEAANGIIAHNEIRLGKTLRAIGSGGRPVRLVRCHTDIDEARRVVGLIQDLLREGKSPDEIAVLYRTNALSRPFEDELRRQGLSYRIVGGMRFYDRKEVKDVLATLRAALNPASDVDTLRMIGAVPRGIGDASLAKIQAVARAHRVPLLVALGDEALLDEAGVSSRVKKKALALFASLDELGRKARPSPEGKPPPLLAREAVALAISRSGVADRLEAEGTPDAEGRLENLSQLLSAAAQHDADCEAEGTRGHAQSFLEAAALTAGEEGAAEDEQREKVTLMTLHAAKGLEFEAVFLVGLEEHGFPHSRALAEGAPASELEEERRLAYVGITRAKERLVLSYAERRMVHGRVLRRQPSRFVDEIPEEVLEGDRPLRHDLLGFSPGFIERVAGDASEPQDGIFLEYDGPSPAAPRRRAPSLLSPREADAERVFDADEPAKTPLPPPLERGFSRVRERLERARVQGEPRLELEASARPGAKPAPLREGDRVRHAAFGEGTVVGLRGGGARLSALVRFDEARAPRVIIARHLERLDARDDEVRVVLDEAAFD